MNVGCGYHVTWTVKSASVCRILTPADEGERVADFIISNANGCV